MTIGILLISTGKYDIFIQPLIDSIDKYFFKSDNINIYLFTDKINIKLNHSERITVKTFPIKHKPFPYPTLYRYKYFNLYAEKIDAEYIFYSDIDMRFVDFVDKEMLGDITCVKHPGFYKGGWGSEGCNPSSLAWIPKESQKEYFAGGFQGGKREKYLSVCRKLAENIDIDESNGVMAVWHDETHWNSFLNYGIEIDHPDWVVRKLNPSYCYPESWNLPFPKKLLALDKNHAEIRK